MSAPGAGPVGTGGAAGFFALPFSIFRRAWRDASWSLAGSVLTVLSGLATLKIIGKLVSTAEYGAASLILGVCALLNQFIANPLLAERLRLYFDHRKQGDQKNFSQAIEGLLLRTSALIASIYLALAALLYLRGNATYVTLFLPALLLIFMQPQLAAVFSQMEAHRDYRGLSLVQPLLNVLQVPLLLGLLWLAVRGSVSIVLAQALAALLVFLPLVMRMRVRSVKRSPRTESGLSSSSISSFGWSLYAFNLASWAMGTSDRYLIDHFLTRSDVGIYVINYAFWAIPYAVLNGWINSFARPRLYVRAADRAWGRVLRVVLGTLSAGAAIAIAGTGLIYIVGKPLALLILGEKYWHSDALMLLLASAHVFFLIGHTTSTYFMAIKNSHWVWISSVIAAIGNMAANILLLPRWGVIAAAVTTLGAYALWSALMLSGMFFWSRRMAAQPTVV